MFSGDLRSTKFYVIQNVERAKLDHVGPLMGGVSGSSRISYVQESFLKKFIFFQ